MPGQEADRDNREMSSIFYNNGILSVLSRITTSRAILMSTHNIHIMIK